MLKRIDPSLSGVHWAEISAEQPFTGVPGEPRRGYDLAVVGGGFCGLSIALHAARRGASVVLAEAGRVGCGASGRNGGIVVPQFPGAIRPSQVEALLGRRRGRRLCEIVAGGPAFVFEQVSEHQIRCDAEQNGWVQPAHSPASLARIRAVFDEWKAFGAPCEWLDAEGVKARLGASGYLGGWVSPAGGTVNPYALAQGLAAAAARAGVQIFQHTPVTAIEPVGGSVEVRGEGFKVRATKVVIATNGYTGGLLAGLARSVIPIRLFHTLTRPLDSAERAQVLPTRAAFTDTRKSGGFSRYDRTGRILSGGAVFTLGNARSYGTRHSLARLRELFPQLRGLTIERYWEGYCALSPSYLPTVQAVAANVYAVLGFSTRGVSLTQNLGREMARFLCGEISADDLPAAYTPPTRITLQRTKAVLGGLSFPVFQARDRLGLS